MFLVNWISPGFPLTPPLFGTALFQAPLAVFTKLTPSTCATPALPPLTTWLVNAELAKFAEADRAMQALIDAEAGRVSGKHPDPGLETTTRLSKFDCEKGHTVLST